MAEGMDSWLQEHTAGGGDWVSRARKGLRDAFGGVFTHKSIESERSKPNALDVLRGKTAPATPAQPTAPAPAPAPAPALNGARADAGVAPEAAMAAGGGLLASTQAGLRGAASKVGDFFKSFSPKDIGAAAGEAVNTAGAAADAVKNAAGEVKAGYNDARAARGLAGSVQAEQARRAAAGRGLSMQTWPANSGPQNVNALGRMFGAPGTASGAARGLARVAAPLTAGLAAYGAADAAVDQTADVAAGLRAATPENRGQRALEIGRGALSALGLGGVVKPAAAAETARPEASIMSGSVPDTSEPSEAERRAAALEVAKIQTQIDANRAIASPEAGGTGVSVGGLRGSAVSPGGSFNGRQNQFQGAFDSMAYLGAYGAHSRMAKNQEDADVNRANLGLRSEANQIARDRLGLDAVKTRAELAKQARETEEAGAKRFNETIDQMGVELAGERKKGGWLGRDETDQDFDRRIKQTQAKLRGDINYSVGNRKDGKKVGDLSQQEQQQLFLAHKVKQKVEKGRNDVTQVLRDFFGTKRADSRDLYSYMPKTGPKGELLGAEVAALPGGGSYVLRSKNGNTMTATRGMGGEWNLTGPNGPIDADVAALFIPHIEAAAKQKRK